MKTITDEEYIVMLQMRGAIVDLEEMVATLTAERDAAIAEKEKAARIIKRVITAIREMREDFEEALSSELDKAYVDDSLHELLEEFYD
jgi:hypothetical protein